MKKLLLIILSATLLTACGDKKKTISHDHESEPAANTGEAAPASIKPHLTLNNGMKWNADESTNRHASAMVAIVDQHKSVTENNLEALHATGKKLQDEVNLMVKECKMKGPDHDALHAWLEPLMKMVKELNESKDESSAAAVLNRIHEQVGLYNNFFA